MSTCTGTANGAQCQFSCQSALDIGSKGKATCVATDALGGTFKDVTYPTCSDIAFGWKMVAENSKCSGESAEQTNGAIWQDCVAKASASCSYAGFSWEPTTKRCSFYKFGQCEKYDAEANAMTFKFAGPKPGYPIEFTEWSMTVTDSRVPNPQAYTFTTTTLNCVDPLQTGRTWHQSIKWDLEGTEVPRFSKDVVDDATGKFTLSPADLAVTGKYWVSITPYTLPVGADGDPVYGTTKICKFDTSSDQAFGKC